MVVILSVEKKQIFFYGAAIFLDGVLDQENREINCPGLTGSYSGRIPAK